MVITFTLSVLIAVTVPMLTLLSVSVFEPLIARNLVDTTRALYVAETGIEWAFSVLVDTPDGSDALPGAGEEAEGIQPPTDPAAGLVPPAGLLPWGTATITARNGGGVVAGETSLVANDVIILTSTGTVNGAQRTIEVTVRRAPTSPQGGSEGSKPLGQHRIVNWRER